MLVYYYGGIYRRNSIVLEENNVAIYMYETANLWVFVPANKLHRYIF